MRTLLLLTCLFVMGSASAWEKGRVKGDFGASVREVAAGIRNYPNAALFGPDNDDDYYSETIIRLTASNVGIAGLPGLGVIEYHLVGGMVKTSMQSGAGLGGLSQSSGGRRYRDSLFEMDDKTWNEASARYYLNLDRANVKVPFSFGDLTGGRQAITFGETYFWNPLDIFNPFDARSFDRDYKQGVDVIRMDVPLGDFAGMNVVAGSYGRESYYKENVFLFRCYGDLLGWDTSLQWGQLYGGNQFGYGFTGEAGAYEFRGEAAWFKSKIEDRVPTAPGIRMLDDSFTGVLGMGRKVAEKVTVEAEYLYNGSGIPEHMNAGAVRVSSGDSLQISRQLAGVSVSWEAMPLLTARFGTIYSFSDGSRAFQPGITCSLSNESELVVGAVINMGKRPGTDATGFPRMRSEFGTNPDVGYIEFKGYF